MSTEQHLLTKIKNRYLFLRGIETALLAAGVAFLTFAVASFFSGSTLLSLLLAIGAGATTAALRIAALKLYPFGDGRITTYLNHHYPQLEASTDLLLTTGEELSTLQHLQKSNIYQKLQSLEADIHFPHRIRLALIILLSGIVIWLASGYYKSSTTPHNNQANHSPAMSSSANKERASVVTLIKTSITVNPPAYTQVSSSVSTQLPLKVIEGSQVKWNFQFEGTAQKLSLVFSGKDSVELKPGKEGYSFQRSISDGGFYQYAWMDSGHKLHQSDYFPIEVIKDEAPRITVENLAQFIELKLTDRLIIDLNATLSDDFGLKDSHIIATVSKGSGESVKFREETLRFFKPSQFSGKMQRASRSIDIMKLGLEPGDELYFYIEAFDNKLPAGKSRTETFFIALQDTASYEMTEDQGLGVDLMPEYFRSQRQIIIDSEKLLEERKEKKIRKEDFNAKSNELGYDQKVLRLRYGQFMGEEAESGIGLQNTLPSEEDEKAEDVMKKFGHTHDTENEHNLVGDKKQSGDDHHDHDNKPGDTHDDDKNPMAAFTHSHDNADEATFFEQSMKTKLKAALTLMWDAELYLRMYQPDQSLPYQYKILKLLKEISNDSRVYVHRSGFDPPPLKEEKRLSGDLSELKNSFHQNASPGEPVFPAIRKALITLEALLQKEQPAMTAAIQTQLQKAGNELAGVAMQQPGAYLKSLSLLQSIIANKLEPDQLRPALVTIRESFWKVLPPETVSPGVKQNVSHPLAQQFLYQLQELKHER